MHKGKGGVVANQSVLRLHSLVFILLSQGDQRLLGRVIDIGLKLLHVYNLALSLNMGFCSSNFQLIRLELILSAILEDSRQTIMNVLAEVFHQVWLSSAKIRVFVYFSIVVLQVTVILFLIWELQV